VTSQEIHDQVKASARRCIAHAGLHHAIGQSLENLVVGMAELAMTFEREACAEIAKQVADGYGKAADESTHGYTRTIALGAEGGATRVALRIEARGKQS
jgi:hypothetical protein